MWLELCGGAWGTETVADCCSELGVRTGGLTVGLSQVALGKSCLLISPVLSWIASVSGPVLPFPFVLFQI